VVRVDRDQEKLLAAHRLMDVQILAGNVGPETL
jgi:hypothetical protein